MDAARVSEVLERSSDGARGEAPPPRVHDREPRGRLVDQEHGQTVRHEYRQREVLFVADDRVGVRCRTHVAGLAHRRSVHLAHGDQARSRYADRLGHAPSILFDRTVVVPHVIAEIECVVGTDAYAIEAVGHEGVDAKLADALDGMHVEQPSDFPLECYVPWHVAQCPMTSRACEVAAKPCWTVNSSTIAATVRSKARLGVTSITLPHIEQSKWW